MNVRDRKVDILIRASTHGTNTHEDNHGGHNLCDVFYGGTHRADGDETHVLYDESNGTPAAADSRVAREAAVAFFLSFTLHCASQPV